LNRKLACRNLVRVLAHAVAFCCITTAARADSEASDPTFLSPAPDSGESPTLPEQKSLWDKLALRLEAGYSKGHVFDVPFGGPQVHTSVGVINGPLTMYAGFDGFSGSTENDLPTSGAQLHLALELRSWRLRIGGGCFAGSFAVQRVSGGSGSLVASDYGMWGDATFDLIQFQAGKVPLAILAGARAYIPRGALGWSPAFVVGIHL
jgi:hypothetical protein